MYLSLARYLNTWGQNDPGQGLVRLIRGLFLGPGVSFIVYLRQVLKIKVCIDLGCTDIGVTEQFLYRTQVTTGFQQVAGKGMSQHVGVNVIR